MAATGEALLMLLGTLQGPPVLDCFVPSPPGSRNNNFLATVRLSGHYNLVQSAVEKNQGRDSAGRPTVSPPISTSGPWPLLPKRIQIERTSQRLFSLPFLEEKKTNKACWHVATADNRNAKEVVSTALILVTLVFILAHQSNLDLGQFDILSLFLLHTYSAHVVAPPFSAASCKPHSSKTQSPLGALDCRCRQSEGR
jgi:hypothetical protein